jgi:hypothetical protein
VAEELVVRMRRSSQVTPRSSASTALITARLAGTFGPGAVTVRRAEWRQPVSRARPFVGDPTCFAPSMHLARAAVEIVGRPREAREAVAAS